MLEIIPFHYEVMKAPHKDPKGTRIESDSREWDSIAFQFLVYLNVFSLLLYLFARKYTLEHLEDFTNVSSMCLGAAVVVVTPLWPTIGRFHRFGGLIIGFSSLLIALVLPALR